MKKLLTTLAPAVVLALTLSACGGDSKGKADGGAGGAGGKESKGTQTMDPELLKVSREKFVACMRQLGYDMPEPSAPGYTGSPKNFDSMGQQQRQKVNKDKAQCVSKISGGNIPPPPPPPPGVG